MTGRPLHEQTMTPLRKRVIQITDEYEAARASQSEKVAVAQLALALARAEQDAARLRAAEEALDEKLSVEAADKWLSHRFHQVCDERDALRAALVAGPQDAPRHNHPTREIREPGSGCPACEAYHAQGALVADAQVGEAGVATSGSYVGANTDPPAQGVTVRGR